MFQLGEFLDDALCIVGVEHRETAAQICTRMFDLQELQSERMERAHAEAFGRGAGNETADAFAHFARGLVGKRDRGDLGRRQAAALDQVGDLLGDHARLARTRAGEHEQGTVAVLDRGALLGIQGHAGKCAGFAASPTA